LDYIIKMTRRKFKSYLFHRDINPKEKDFFALVKAELLYRIFDLDEKNCSCMGCTQNIEKYYAFLQKILKDEREAIKKEVEGRHKK